LWGTGFLTVPPSPCLSDPLTPRPVHCRLRSAPRRPEETDVAAAAAVAAADDDDDEDDDDDDDAAADDDDDDDADRTGTLGGGAPGTRACSAASGGGRPRSAGGSGGGSATMASVGSIVGGASMSIGSAPPEPMKSTAAATAPATDSAQNPETRAPSRHGDCTAGDGK
jgi:hypothetical protein